MRNSDDRNKNATSKRGFAAMSPDKREEIASKGGHASAARAGHEGMAERGRHGGENSRSGSSKRGENE